MNKENLKKIPQREQEEYDYDQIDGNSLIDQSLTFAASKQADRLSGAPQSLAKLNGRKGKKEMSAREKALEFAKNNVPRPKAKAPKPENGQGSANRRHNSDIEPVMKHSPQKE